VDPVYFEGAYYLGPDKGGERAYALLAAAMRQTGRSALAKYAARGKMYIVMVRAIDKGLVMQTLHYADEVRSFDEVPVGDSAVKEGELKLAIQLVDQIATEEFHPENYEDEVRKRYLAAIQRKAEGHQVVMQAPEEPRAQVIDLMEALKASLAKAGGKTAEAERKPARKAKPEAVASARAAPAPRRAAGGRR
jgi:DNA end-binding protein Ku